MLSLALIFSGIDSAAHIVIDWQGHSELEYRADGRGGSRPWPGNVRELKNFADRLVLGVDPTYQITDNTAPPREERPMLGPGEGFYN